LLHTKSLIRIFLVCLLLADLAGCGSDRESTAPPEDPGKELARWFKGVEAAVARMEQKQRGFTQFEVAQPPPASGLAKLSPAGAKAGETALDAAEQLDAATPLSSDEAAGLYCYFFAFYVDLESSPNEAEFEVVIENLVKTKLPTSSSAAEVGESADALHKAMIEAEKAGGDGPEVAAAGFC
jgi:hypothetical protein